MLPSSDIALPYRMPSQVVVLDPFGEKFGGQVFMNVVSVVERLRKLSVQVVEKLARFDQRRQKRL